MVGTRRARSHCSNRASVRLRYSITYDQRINKLPWCKPDIGQTLVSRSISQVAARVRRSRPLGKISCRRLHAALEHVERIEAARFAVGWKKDRVSAALDGSDNHEIVRQMETLDAEVCMLCAELFPHARFKVFGGIRITKDRLAFAEKPTDLDQRAGIGGCAREWREVCNDDVAFLHHCDVLFINRLPDFQLRSDCLGIFVERRQTAQTQSPAYLHLRCGVRNRIGKKHVRTRQVGYCCHNKSLQIGP